MTTQAIQDYATLIKVPFLVHFTRAVNLPSIMTHGLYPIARAHEVGAAPIINDRHRIDGRLGGTSLSIAFPNCQMLYKYRMESAGTDWAIIVLEPSVLWEKECAFCRHNAADNRIRFQPLPKLMKLEAFSGMFEEIEGIESRSEQKLNTFDPTDVQAEVLVFDVVEPRYIAGALFDSVAAQANYAPFMGGRQTAVHANNKGLFASRGYARKYQ
ncbi:DarT ssDNA thymidine ADP-ribosyltransferase family protein [Azospirillum sp. TSH64]|uniref:DarT ssDNA thymidine ADP-ribosyltransferase family protein n=1 Tax=Azospirillum sp. TSH64 TaxID=652740 RepID=UPI000D65C170|nr:DarT ssDNA thymidine ADP-ribosyltransferase family protein [Azospirillum sp. TSH64]